MSTHTKHMHLSTPEVLLIRHVDFLKFVGCVPSHTHEQEKKARKQTLGALFERRKQMIRLYKVGHKVMQIV